MSRPIRIEFAGAVYHVMARGNQGQKIYADDGDRKMWLATLAEAWRRTGWRIHAWALMGNHYHLLVETREPNLVGGMKWLQSTYTQRYNARHHKRGHLFQGRYRAVPVAMDEAQYFQTVSTYIHLNPARAKQIRIGEEKLWEYPWSSYPHYIREGGPEWLVKERVLGSLGLGPKDYKGYETYVETRALELGIKAGRLELEAQWKILRRGWYIGGESFGESLLEQVGQGLLGRRESHAGAARQAHDLGQAERMLEKGIRALGLGRQELSAKPKGLLEKQVLAWWVFGNTVVPRRWLAEKLWMGYETAVSRAVSLVESSKDKRVKEMKSKLSATGLG